MPSVQKDGTVWHKRILLPLWLIRMAITGVFLITSILAIALSAKQVHDPDPEINDKLQEANGAEFTINWKAALGVSVGFFLIILLILLLDLLSLVKFLRHSLTPKSLLISGVIQTTIWLAFVGLEIWDTTRGASVAGLVGSLVILLFFLALLFYAFRQHRSQKRGGRRGNYQPAVNPAAGGFQSQQAYGGSTQGSVPYKTGAYEPYGGQQTGYTGYNGAVEMKPQGGAADSYYNSSNTYRGAELPERDLPPTQVRPMV